ncbi:MAG: AAA family ATPase [Muribaculaceae bacterium]|nr:AAA family ATPase [Muribaculaceae bacterium]
MFRRKLLTNLEEWKASPGRKPLVLRGARQVGKTSLVHEFGKTFDNYLYLNLEQDELCALFRSTTQIEELMTLIFAILRKTRLEGSMLLFIDEIQNCPEAIASLRYFYEDSPEIHVIAAGSLLENVVDVRKSFPVGRVQYLAMRPCFFEEFLWANGDEELAGLLDKPSMTVPVHKPLMDLFNMYTVVGGMPEVVAEFVRRHDITALEDVYESLLMGYRDDVEKYVLRGKEIDVVRFLLTVGWSKAGETISLGNFAGSNYRASDIGEGFRLLHKAMLTELVYPVSGTGLPVIGETSRSPKLIWFDTGLVNYASGVQTEVLRAVSLQDSWRGNVAEQIVAQELLAMSDKVSATRNYWRRNEKGSSAEVDFIFTYKSRVYPVEVKAGHNAHLKSLHSFMERSEGDIAFRIWPNPLSVDTVTTAYGKTFRLVSVPFYLGGRLDRVVDWLSEQ